MNAVTETPSPFVFTDSAASKVKDLIIEEGNPDLKWPADLYLEGSDQHRGWFHSSLLESCGTRGRAPYDIVLTHGFCLDEKGEKMSKSKGNVTAPQDIIKDSGADILRLWVAAADYSDDLRIGKEILKTFVETYRKLRNTMRWMLGTLAHFSEDIRVAEVQTMPELERLMLHRLAEIGLHRIAQRTGYDVDDSANGVRHHEADGFGRISLGARLRRGGRRVSHLASPGRQRAPAHPAPRNLSLCA